MMKNWNKRRGLQRMMARFMVLVIVLFVIQPVAFAQENTPQDESSLPDASGETVIDETETMDAAKPDAPQDQDASAEPVNFAVSLAPESDEEESGEIEETSEVEETSEIEENGEDEPETEGGETEGEGTSPPTWSDPDVDSDKDLYDPNAGRVWVQFDGYQYLESDDGPEQYYFDGSHSLHVYAVDPNNPTKVRVSADGQSELWIDLKGKGANVQGTYRVDKFTVDPYVLGKYIAKDKISFTDDKNNPVDISTGTPVNVINWGWDDDWDLCYEVEYTIGEGDEQVTKTFWVNSSSVTPGYEVKSNSKVYIHGDDGNNRPDVPEGNITVIGWDNNKWGIGAFYQVKYKVKVNGQLEERTGWISKANVSLMAVATTPYPEEKPAKPADLGDKVVYLGESGDYSTIFAHLKDNPYMPAQLYKLVDKDGRAFYAYCADHNVMANSGYTYIKTDITELMDEAKLKGNPDVLRIFGYDENADVGDKDAAVNAVVTKAYAALGKINAIVKNGYQNGGGNLDAIKEAVKTAGYADAANNITEGIALTATQTAIWYTVHGEDLVNIDGMNGGYALKKLLGYCYHAGNSHIANLADDDQQAVFAMLEYLTELPADYEAASGNANDPLWVPLSVNVSLGQTNAAPKAQAEATRQASYSGDVLFTLSVPSGESFSYKLWNELWVVVSVAGETQKMMRLLDVEQKDGVYIIPDIELKDGQRVDIAVGGEVAGDGNQGIYLFTADGGSNKSQTFVGTAGVGGGGQSSGVRASGWGSAKFSVTPSSTPTPSSSPSPSPDPSSSPSPSPDPSSSPSPSPDPSSSPTPDPSSTPNPSPTPNPTPSYPPELPDPNDPDSPDEITIIEDDVPKTYIKVWDPEEEEYVWIPEEDLPLIDMPGDEEPQDDVPLANVAKTGDDIKIWELLALISASGLIWLIWEDKKSRTFVK